MPRDRDINTRPTSAGRQRRLTGHEQLCNKLSHRDVSSCRFSLYRQGLSPLHILWILNVYVSGRRGWWGVRVHIGPYWAESLGRAPPWGGVGQGGFLVVYRSNIRCHVYYTILLVSVRANINQCLKTETWSVRTRTGGPYSSSVNTISSCSWRWGVASERVMSLVY